MKYQEKQILKSKVCELLRVGDSAKQVLQKLESDGYKPYEIDPQLINAKLELYSEYLPFIEGGDESKLSSLDPLIVEDLVDKYAKEKTSIKIRRIKELAMNGKSLSEIEDELKDELPKDLIEKTYKTTLAENENLNPGALAANLSKVQLGLVLSVLYTVLKIVQIGLQLVRGRMSILTLITLIVGVIGIIYFGNKKNNLKQYQTD